MGSGECDGDLKCVGRGECDEDLKRVGRGSVTKI